MTSKPNASDQDGPVQRGPDQDGPDQGAPQAAVPEPEFSRLVNVMSLSNVEKGFAFEASSGELAALTKRLGVTELKKFHIQAVLHLLPNGDVLAKFAFQAFVEQRCVVTLEPVNTNISSTFTTTYSKNADENWGRDEEEFEDLDAEIEPPEPLVGGTIDIGEACTEQLALEIDPFPRVQGATFEGYSTEPQISSSVLNIGGTGKKNPFAVLSKLKTQKENNE